VNENDHEENNPNIHPYQNNPRQSKIDISISIKKNVDIPHEQSPIVFQINMVPIVSNSLDEFHLHVNVYVQGLMISAFLIFST
jgi:hypothetical protein